MGSKPQKGKTKRKQEEPARSLDTNEVEVWSHLVEEWEKDVFEFIHRRVPDDHLADDLFQNVFLKAFRSRAQFDPEIPGLGWIKTIAKGVISDHFRKLKAQKRDEPPIPTKYVDGAQVSSVDERAARDSPVDELVAIAEQAGVLKEAISSLSEDDQELVEMFYKKGLPNLEIANQLNKSEHAVKSSLQRVRKKLKPKLKQIENDITNIEINRSEQ